MMNSPSSPTPRFTRRGLARLLAAAPFLGGTVRAADQVWKIATFAADVTVPLGHPLMGGGVAPARRVVDPLWAKGIVLTGPIEPIVLVSVDWCEIRNDAHDRWREALGQAAGCDPKRVIVSAIHQHDAPVVDLEAQRILERKGARGSVCDLAFHERAVQAVASSLKKSLERPRPFTHIGLGEAKVREVASNRRYLSKDGRPEFGRMSATRDPEIRAKPEGTIDPALKTVAFRDGDRTLAALHCYATHPMSYYGQGGVSGDFVGMARERLQKDDPNVFQIYVSGCSGNVTAGKYNDGSPENRPELINKMYRAMAASMRDATNHKVTRIDFKSVPLRLEPRDHPGFSVSDLTRRLDDPKPFTQCLAALGLSWRKRADAGRKLDVPVIDFGPARILLLPGESYVEYQLLAQSLRPDLFVMLIGYGESATGYVPIDRAFDEGDSNLRDWCWVAPGSEKAMTEAIRLALKD